MNGISVTRVKDTIFIPLPREQWREIEGGCACQYCSVDGKAATPAYWDTLAVSAKRDASRAHDTTWTVHYPELHGAAQPKRKAVAR